MFETINELAEIKKVLAPHLALLIQAALKISVYKEYSLNLREITLMFLELVSENYAKFLQKRLGKEVIEQIVQTGFVIASESEEMYEGEQETRKLIFNLIPYSSHLVLVYDLQLFLRNPKQDYLPHPNEVCPPIWHIEQRVREESFH